MCHKHAHAQKAEVVAELIVQDDDVVKLGSRFLDAVATAGMQLLGEHVHQVGRVKCAESGVARAQKALQEREERSLVKAQSDLVARVRVRCKCCAVFFKIFDCVVVVAGCCYQLEVAGRSASPTAGSNCTCRGSWGPCSYCCHSRFDAGERRRASAA